MNRISSILDQFHNVNKSKTKKDIILHKSTKYFWSIFRTFLLIGLGYIILYPILYMFTITFRDINDMYDTAVKWIPKHLTFANFQRVWSSMAYPKALFTTLIITIVCSIGNIITCSLTAYGLARFKFKGKGIIFAVVILTVIVPQQFYILPSSINLKFFDLFGLLSIFDFFTGSNTHIELLHTNFAMFIPALLGNGIRAGLFIYIFRQYFKGMPKELEEAAYIDGCGYLKTYIRIMAPSAIPAFVTVFLFSFVWYWNDYQVSCMLLDDKQFTLSSALVMLNSIIYGSDTTGTAPIVNTTQTLIDMQTGSLLVVTPVVILYLFLQKFFIQSIERTGIVE